MTSDPPAAKDLGHPPEAAGRPEAADRRAESERLFREHNDALLSYAYTRVLSWADAKDVVQEAYVRVFGLGKDRPISHLRAYLYAAVRNCATDWVRRRNVRESFADLEYFRLDKVTGSAEQIWLLRDEIQRALNVLPPKCRLAMILVNVRGLTYEEAAEQMGIKTHSVRRLLERSVEYVLESLRKDEPTRSER
ncbi:MAG TPA: sigma-70 family RNA polymerase sigma factor [Steroidobacter sp.]